MSGSIKFERDGLHIFSLPPYLVHVVFKARGVIIDHPGAIIIYFARYTRSLMMIVR